MIYDIYIPVIPIKENIATQFLLLKHLIKLRITIGHNGG